MVRHLHHIGYVVEDIPAAVEWAAAALGAGPFFELPHLDFDELTYQGAPAELDTSVAFGQWGDVRIELTRVRRAEPAGLATRLGGPGPSVNHVAWLVDDVEAESERLAAAGMPLFQAGEAGPVRAHWHDGRALLGHHVEVIRRRPELEGFYALLGSAADGWDGSDPLRPLPTGPPAPR